MLALGLVNEIKRLIETKGLSQRQIAKRLGISRGTVSDVAKGRRRTHTKNADADRSVFSNESELTRCPSCGGKVYMPCLLCQIRSLKQQQRATGEPRQPSQLRAQRISKPSAVELVELLV